MSHLVPYCISQQLLEFEAVAGQPLVRALIDCDPVGKSKAVTDAALRVRASFVKAQQAGLRRLLLDDKSHVVEPAAEAGRDSLQCSLNEVIEFPGRHLITIVGGRGVAE